MTEDELTKKLKNNDNDAYSYLVDMYQKRLYRFCLKILKNSFDASDAVQITFIKVHTAITSFEKRGSFSSWIYKIAFNACNDILRQKKKSKYVFLEDYKDFPKIHSKEKTPEENLIFYELNEKIRYEIKKLPKNQQALIFLRDIHGFSYKETAHILSMKEGTVKSGINRARKKLKENLKKYLN